MYQKNLKSPFPDDLADLCKEIANAVGTELEPEAAIVNYYPIGATMGGHLDDAEYTMEKPIISISLGCSAIFLLGGRDKTVKPTPILVRSGDVIVMSGESRYCYHGVPYIVPVDFQPLVDESGELTGLMGESFSMTSSSPTAVGFNVDQLGTFMRSARININVRQVRKNPNDVSDHDWIDRSGTGAIV